MVEDIPDKNAFKGTNNLGLLILEYHSLFHAFISTIDILEVYKMPETFLDTS